MKITVMDYTSLPINLISLSAGTCYGKDDAPAKRAETAFKRGHMSVFEHAKVTVYIEGISRACANQLVRHRMASYCQESQRYVKVDTTGDQWYVMPPSVSLKGKTYYKFIMLQAAKAYHALLDSGIAPEDARYVLPNACKTNIMMTMNVRELFHFFALRDDSHAQWEIRKLAQKLREACSELDSDWNALMKFDKE